jgi:phage terminase large subunit-like protein
MITSSLNESYPFAWFAPTYRMLLDNWRQVRNTLAPVTVRANDSEHRLELINGSIVEMWSLDNHDAARGRKYRKIFINEAAMIKTLQESWEMVIRPTLADYQGAAYFASTPKGLNYFYTLCQQAESNSDWAAFHYRTSDNPHISQAEIDGMRRMLPASTFQQEIEAEFMADGSYFQGVDAAAVILTPDLPDQHKNHTIVMGVDWAKSADWTVLTLGCRDCNRVVDWRRFNQIDYHYQRKMLADIAQRWSVNRILAESNSIGEPNIEELARAGLPVTGFTTTANSKAEMIEALHLALVNGGLKVPKDYADELRAFEIEIRAGAPKFGAPSGFHDDRVISLALCNRAMSKSNVAVVSFGDSFQ